MFQRTTFAGGWRINLNVVERDRGGQTNLLGGYCSSPDNGPWNRMVTVVVARRGKNQGIS